MWSTLPQQHSSTPTLGQQHHSWHNDECKSREFDDGESRLKPGTPGDAPRIEGEDHVWRGDHTATAAAYAWHMQEKYSSVPCSRGAGEKAASSQRGWWGERCQETLQVWPSIQLLKGELNYASKRNQQPGSCLVIHTCLGERCESAGTSQQPLCQRTPARSRQYSFTGWVHQARCPKP